jgi:hypothetical protein
MQAVSRIEDKNRTSVPVNPERRRRSGWATFNKIRLPTLDGELKKAAWHEVLSALKICITIMFLLGNKSRAKASAVP